MLSILTLALPELTSDRDRLSQNEEWQTATISTLLRLASLDPVALKTVLGKIDGEGRVRLESMLRLVLGEKEDKNVEEQTTPSILLTMDFASIE